MSVLILETHNQENYKCLPKFARRIMRLKYKNDEDALPFWTDNASPSRETANWEVIKFCLLHPPFAKSLFVKVVYRTLIREKGLHISTTATTGYQFYFQFERTVIDLSFETELRHSPVLPRAMKATTTAASLDKVTHLRARQSPYPKSNQRRHHVPDSLIDWKVCKLVGTNVIQWDPAITNPAITKTPL